MSKSIKDLNWSLFLVHLMSAITIGLGIGITANMTVKGTLLSIVVIASKDATAFFANAKKILDEEEKKNDEE